MEALCVWGGSIFYKERRKEGWTTEWEKGKKEEQRWQSTQKPKAVDAHIQARKRAYDRIGLHIVSIALSTEDKN